MLSLSEIDSISQVGFFKKRRWVFRLKRNNQLVNDQDGNEEFIKTDENTPVEKTIEQSSKTEEPSETKKLSKAKTESENNGSEAVNFVDDETDNLPDNTIYPPFSINGKSFIEFYKKLTKLGRGGFGEVFTVTEITTEKELALKVENIRRCSN